MSPHCIAFIDSRVADYETLIAGFSADTRWHVLVAQQDGVAQIERLLAGESGLDAIHIISHGAPGTLYLGSTLLTSSNLPEHAQRLQSIGASLTATGDILLYGCNVAQGEEGQAFVNALAALTGADVAASTDATGSAAAGANSVLEIQTGVVETSTLNLSGVVDTLAANTAPTFTLSDGKLTTDFGGTGIATDVDIQADGKIIIAGYQGSNPNENIAIARYSTDGYLDSSFDIDGKVIVENSGQAYISSLGMQADGKILVAGQYTIARYNADGSLDATFGVFGKVRTNSEIHSIQIQGDGKIIFSGDQYTSYPAPADFSLSRLNIDGSLDFEFSFDGSQNVDFGGSDENAICFLQADGKILVSGIVYQGGRYNIGLARFNSNGEVDGSFGVDGKIITDFGSSAHVTGLTVDKSGKILVSVNTTSDFFLVRYNADGSLDTSFDTDGKVTTDLGGYDTGRSITVQSDGKILVGGVTYLNGSHDFALARYNADGSLDTSFDTDGKVTTDFGGDDYGSSITVQADGKILVGGYSYTNGSSAFALARYNSDGSLDTTFSPPENTLQQRGPAAFTESGYSPVILAPDAGILDAQLAAAGHYAGTTLTLARQGGANAQDVFSNSGTLSALNPGSYFAVDGVTIGRVTTNNNGTLFLAFNSNATQSLVNKATQQIAYSNTSDAPPTSVAIDWTFNDGNTGAQGTGGALSVTSTSYVTITPTNDAPYVAAAVPDKRVEVNTPFSYQLPTGTFIDPDLETLSYSVTMADGTGVPPWLTFNRATQTFSGTPSADDVGSFDIQIKATDATGVSAYDYVNVTVYQNTAPTLAISAIPPYIYESEYNDDRFYADRFTDSVAGHLSSTSDVDWYSVYLDAPGMQSVTFDASTMSYGIWNVYWYDPSLQVLSGRNIGPSMDTPAFTYEFPAFSSGVYYVRVQESNIYFNNGGSYHIYMSKPEDYTYTDSTADDSFRTISGDLIGSDVDSATSLTYGLQGGVLSNDFIRLTGIYGQMTVNPTNGAFTFTPNNAAIQGLKTNTSESYTFTVSDGKATTTLERIIAFVGADDATELSGALQGAVQEDGAVIASGALTVMDRDAGEGAFIAQSSASGVYGSFSIATNGAWTYTLNNSAAQVQQLKAGQSAQETFTVATASGATQTITVAVNGANDAPAATSVAQSGSEDTAISGSVSATDTDRDALTYTALTSPQHGTVVFNPNGSYTYTPAANYAGTDSFTFKASDGTLDSNTATVSITVTPVNDAPVLANALADRSVTLGSNLNFAFAGNTFTDVDSPSLTYTAKLANGAALPSWLSFNPATRTFSGTPTAADLGTLTVKVTASDGALSVADAFDLVISERPNTSPTGSNAAVSTKEDTPLTGALPGATDAEGDPVTYAKASDPAKGTVSVNPSGAFTYTPAANANGADSFTYTVTDDRGASSTYSVSLTITPVNDAPVITPLAPLAFVDTAQADIFLLEMPGQIQAQDIDSASLSYRISGGTNVGAYSTVQGTYGSLQVHIGTGAYTFFANNAAIQGLKSNANETFSVAVSDGALTAEAPLTVQITGGNDAPVLIAPISDQTAYDASAWSLTLSGAQFSDADTGDVLTYTATLANGAALPTWLSFDPATRMFSGTPSAADVGSLSIRVSASDGSLSASDVFSLVVNEYFEPVVDDSSVATYARSANQYTIRFDPVSKDLLVTDTDPQQYEVRKFTNAKRIEFADLTLNLAVSDLADTIAEPALNRIAELYVAFFNRVPDGDGMEFWLGQYRQGKTINDIADAFYNAGVYFSDLTGYRADMSNDDFIHIVYRNVLGRPEGADQEGLAFWRTELDSGRSAKGTLVSSILDAAHGSTFSEPTNPYHWVQKLLDNKLEVAKQVSVDWGVNYNSSEDSIAKGQAIAASITPDDTSMAISLVGVVVADMV